MADTNDVSPITAVIIGTAPAVIIWTGMGVRWLLKRWEQRKEIPMQDVIVDYQEPLGMGLHARITVEYLGQAEAAPGNMADWDTSYDSVKVRGRLWFPTDSHKDIIHPNIPFVPSIMGAQLGAGANWGTKDGNYRYRESFFMGTTQRLATEAALAVLTAEAAKVKDAVSKRSLRLELRRQRLTDAEQDLFDFNAWKCARRLLEGTETKK